MKNLVMGLAKGYDFEQLRPFVGSLRETGYDGDICLFYANTDKRTLKALQEYRVDLVPFKYQPPELMRPLLKLPPVNRFFTKYRMAPRFLNVYCVRFPLYQGHLAGNEGRYANVLISDVCDVIFQRDPFDFDLGDEVCVFLEDARERIRDCRFNASWLRRDFGEGALDELGDNVVSCAGVTLGSYRAMLHYLEVMNQHLQRQKSHRTGMDQGVHNYVLYKGRLKGARVFANGRGPVLTMGKTTDLPTRFDERGRVLNDDATVPAVPHQYDRHIERGRLALDGRGDSFRLKPT